MVADIGQHDVKALRIAHDVFQRLELGHIPARFLGHAQVQIAHAQALVLVFCPGALHAALAPVVGRQRQVPIAEHAVQLFQVIQRSARGGQHIAPVIAEGVLAQLEIGARGRHELPHASGLGTGDGTGVVGTLDERQQRQLRGHAAALELLNDVKQVFARALAHAQHGVGPAGIPLLAVMHQRRLQIGHGKARAHALPHVARRLQAIDAQGLQAAMLDGRELAGLRRTRLRCVIAHRGLHRAAAHQHTGPCRGQPKAHARPYRYEIHTAHCLQNWFFQARSSANHCASSCGGGSSAGCWPCRKCLRAWRTAGSRLRKKGLIWRSCPSMAGSVG